MAFTTELRGIEGLKRAMKEAAADVEKAAHEEVKHAVEAARVEALRALDAAGIKDRTGDLRKGIRPGPGRRSDGRYTASGVLEFLAKHTVFVDQDTKPHDIEVRGNPVLAFAWKSEDVFFRYVTAKHPGTKGVGFVKKAHAVARRVLRERMKIRIAKIIAKLNRRKR
jgi:hypothetical protein